MRVRRSAAILAMAAGLAALGAVQARGAYMTVDVLSLTLPATSLPDLRTLGTMYTRPDYGHLPFYLRVNIPPNNQTNWGIELYSDNRQVLGNSTPANGLYRGLRSFTDLERDLPLYWQVYDYDQEVWRTWGTPQSVTATTGGLGFYEPTLRYWGTIYDRSDVDRVNTWDTDRAQRVVASVEGLGPYPSSGRSADVPAVYLYFGADLRDVISGPDYLGQLTLDLFQYPFDFSRGGYATPNPVKPLRGERVYFNFYTNSPDSPITIRIVDPTGYPVVTLHDTRYWDARNERGHIVEGGLYIYQIEVEGHHISGTVVVIK